jgi:tRNA dimethylallyltransferase
VNNTKLELIELLGPTSSGKSDIAIDLAQKLIKNGRSVVIIGCDSRQIYKGLDIASGKILGTWANSNILRGEKSYYYRQIEHFLIDQISLDSVYTLADFIEDFCNLVPRLAFYSVDTIILTGGTGLWARAVWENYQIDRINQEDIPEFEEIKSKLSVLLLEELQSQLSQTDFNNSDWNNSRRLVNAILKNRFRKEGKYSSVYNYPDFTSKTKYIVELETNDLESKISKRTKERLKSGMLEEVKSLIKNYSFERIFNLGLEARQCALCSAGEVKEEELEALITTDIIKYAKRQITWLAKEQDAIKIKQVSDIIIEP